MSSPLRRIETILQQSHHRAVWGRYGYETCDPTAIARPASPEIWTHDCRACTCPAGHHARPHPRLMVALNPSLVRSIVPLNTWTGSGFQITDEISVIWMTQDPEGNGLLYVPGSVEQVFALLEDG